MTNTEKNPIRHGIIASVAAGVILSALYFIPTLAWSLAKFLMAVLRYSYSSIAVPKCLVIILGLLSLVTIVRVLKPILVKNSNEADEAVEPELSMYTSDSFFDVDWQWSSYNNPEPTLTPYCPRCSTPLIYHSSYGVAITFICETCQREVAEFQCDFHQALAQVARQIERKVRTGEWQQVVARQLEEQPRG